ncbi:adenylate kinase 1, chloroplastic-like protein [Tanacetum coccineum]
MSQPVEGFYKDQGKLMEFDLPGGIPESWPKLLEALNLDEYEDHYNHLSSSPFFPKKTTAYDLHATDFNGLKLGREIKNKKNNNKANKNGGQNGKPK